MKLLLLCTVFALICLNVDASHWLWFQPCLNSNSSSSNFGYARPGDCVWDRFRMAYGKIVCNFKENYYTFYEYGRSDCTLLEDAVNIPYNTCNPYDNYFVQCFPQEPNYAQLLGTNQYTMINTCGADCKTTAMKMVVPANYCVFDLVRDIAYTATCSLKDNRATLNTWSNAASGCKGTPASSNTFALSTPAKYYYFDGASMQQWSNMAQCSGN